MQLCRVGVNFGASGFVRFLGSLSFHLRGSGSGGENCSIYAMAASGRMQNDYNNNNLRKPTRDAQVVWKSRREGDYSDEYYVSSSTTIDL